MGIFLVWEKLKAHTSTKKSITYLEESSKIKALRAVLKIAQ